MSIWKACDGMQQIKTLNIEPWRVVEAQHILNARDLVDTLEEYEQLEDLLENSKPMIQTKLSNPLIFTPFRYPPLEYGSRFGRVFETSLWYGSLDITTALTEVAFYRLKFNQDSDADLGYIDTLLTAFHVNIKTKQGIDLTQIPFTEYTANISSKTSYAESQLLGSEMREDNIHAFIFYSARTKQSSKNIAAYTASAFSKKQNQYTYNQQTWKCISNQSEVQIARTDGLGRENHLVFKQNDYL
ncbi:MAG: RES family NAD+ phosphorylase [Legionella sp.]|nr:RES family NAD+ phosphorylase [Legionella sp.]